MFFFNYNKFKIFLYNTINIIMIINIKLILFFVHFSCRLTHNKIISKTFCLSLQKDQSSTRYTSLLPILLKFSKDRNKDVIITWITRIKQSLFLSLTRILPRILERLSIDESRLGSLITPRSISPRHDRAGWLQSVEIQAIRAAELWRSSMPCRLSSWIGPAVFPRFQERGDD